MAESKSRSELSSLESANVDLLSQKADEVYAEFDKVLRRLGIPLHVSTVSFSTEEPNRAWSPCCCTGGKYVLNCADCVIFNAIGLTH